jgi:BioD-like phosphotransacetylase family protein
VMLVLVAHQRGVSEVLCDAWIAQVMLYKRMLEDMDTPVELAGVVINRVEPAQMDSFSTAVRASLSAEGVPLAAVLGMHPELARFRINEILSHPMLSASVLCGAELDRFEASGCVVAAGTCEQCLCECRQSSDPAVVVVDAQRTDVALAMLFAAQSVESNIAAVVLTGAASLAPAVQQLVCAMPAAAQTTPVLLVTQPLMQVALLLTSLVPTVLPSSKRKIDFVMKLFDDSLEEQVSACLRAASGTVCSC